MSHKIAAGKLQASVWPCLVGCWAHVADLDGAVVEWLQHAVVGSCAQDVAQRVCLHQHSNSNSYLKFETSSTQKHGNHNHSSQPFFKRTWLQVNITLDQAESQMQVLARQETSLLRSVLPDS